MSEAPERIWTYAGAFKMWRSDYPSHANNPVEYLRADHVAEMLKAEREKALREAAAICLKPRVLQAMCLARAFSTSSRRTRPMDKPRVKPLVWTQAGCAETPFGKYHVLMEDWSGQDDFWFVCFAGMPYGKCGEHGSEEAAKAAAQADYEARILAALE